MFLQGTSGSLKPPQTWMWRRAAPLNCPVWWQEKMWRLAGQGQFRGHSLSLSVNKAFIVQHLVSLVRNGVPVRPDGVRVHVSADGTLILNNVQSVDEGLYTCNAYSGTYSVSAAAEVRLAKSTQQGLWSEENERWQRKVFHICRVSIMNSCCEHPHCVYMNIVYLMNAFLSIAK